MSSLQLVNVDSDLIVVDELNLEEATGLNVYEETGLALSPDKNVSVEKDSRYTVINIDTKREKSKFNDKFSDCYLKVKIIKDRILETTETHIQKMFVSYENSDSEDLNVIIRDIFVDRHGNSSNRNTKTARTKMKRSQLMAAFASRTEEPICLLEN